jgi:hypothetical protein
MHSKCFQQQRGSSHSRAPPSFLQAGQVLLLLLLLLLVVVVVVVAAVVALPLALPRALPLLLTSQPHSLTATL